jgi:hypothetical protein
MSDRDGWEKVPVPFTGGLETKAATAVVPPDRLALLENGVFTKQGSVAKRAGYTSVPGYAAVGTLDGESRALLDGNGALTLATNRRLYSRVGGLWTSRGRYAPATFQAEEVAHGNLNQTEADSATANGVTAVVWKNGSSTAAGEVYFQLFNAENVPLCAVTEIADGVTVNYPNALAVGDNILLTYVDTAANDLKARVIRTADVAGSVATASTVTIRDDLTADHLYALAPASDGIGIVVWESASGVVVGLLDENAAITTSAVASTDATALIPAAAYNSRTSQVCVAWAVTAGNVEFRVFDYGTLAAVTSETSSTVATSARVALCSTEDDTSYAAGKHFCVAVETTGASEDLNLVTLVTTGTVTTTVVRHAHLASGGFQLAEQGCFMLAHASRTGLQSAYYLYSHDGYLLGAFEHALAVARTTRRQLPSVGLVEGNKCLVLGFKRSLDVDDFQAQFAHLGLRLYRFDDASHVSTARLGNTTYLSGCQLWAYDGNQPVEAGFHMFPDVAASGDLVEDTGGTGTSAGQYSYRFYYEWYNARGERCRSLPMQRSITVAAGSEVDISIPTLRHTLKSATYGRQAEVSIVVYRTEVNSSAVFYRVSSPDPAASGDNGYVANSFTANAVNFTDDMTDAVLVTKERDMFSLAELLNAPVPGPELLYATQDRLFLAGGGVPKGSVLPSKQHDPGEMVEVAPENEVRPCTERITALGSINEVVVAFTEREAHALGGPGFDNAGGGQPFGTGRITTDVGCADPGSVVMIPGGLLFKSSKGIYGMDQSFGVQYVGAPVERYNAQTVKAASVVPDTNQVLFVCDSGYTLMFDYFYGAWGTFSNHLGTDAAVVGDDYAYLRTDGTVFVRAPGTYTDDSAPVILKIRTGRFRADALQAQLEMPVFGILGEYKSPHQLKVRLYYDRNEYASSERTIDVDSIIDAGYWGSSSNWGSDDFWGGSGGITDYRFKVRPRRTKFSQIAFEFEDVITDEAGASFELTELLLKVRPMDGIQNTSAARKA